MSSAASTRPLSRRTLLTGTAGLLGMAALSGCTTAAPDPAVAPSGHPMGPVQPSAMPAPAPGQRVVEATLTPGATTLDLGGPTAATWAYGDTTPGPVIRPRAGDFVRVRVTNRLPGETSVHWHGIRLANAADGVPGLTQNPIAPATSFEYGFTVPDPGTYWYHPHTGIQLDRGLFGALIVDDPHEPGGYDEEWIVVLDDWTDGIGTAPDDIVAGLRAQQGTVSRGMNHNMGHMGGMDSPLGDAGDIAYPHYLLNGRVPAAPVTFTAKPGQRVRIRLINAAADTIFKVALGGHHLTVTHTDGFPVRPQRTDALYVAMGERFDLLVTLGEGVFPLMASAEGKDGRAFALVRTGSGAAPSATVELDELAGSALVGTQLAAADSVRLPDREPDVTLPVELNGQMQPYAWGLNGAQFGHDEPLTVREGQRVRLAMQNMTMMSHPMHLHGHTWSLPDSGGLRKDTVLVLPMQQIVADLQADNPGAWAYHCHNGYHMELGMMTSLSYV